MDCALNTPSRYSPEITPRSSDPVGASDRRVQAYNFRLCMTKTAANRIAWTAPSAYAPDRYRLLAEYLQQCCVGRLGGQYPTGQQHDPTAERRRLGGYLHDEEAERFGRLIRPILAEKNRGRRAA